MDVQEERKRCERADGCGVGTAVSTRPQPKGRSSMRRPGAHPPAGPRTSCSRLLNLMGSGRPRTEARTSSAAASSSAATARTDASSMDTCSA